jgi:surface protein
VTSIKEPFYWKDQFNDDISKWNVSNVTDMSFMFRGTDQFDCDISKWDLSNVTEI